MVTPLVRRPAARAWSTRRAVSSTVSPLWASPANAAISRPTCKAYSRQLAAGTSLPRALGFGISTAEQVRELAPDWDALIVGSAIVRRIAEGAAAGLACPALCCQAGRLLPFPAAGHG